MPNDYLNTQGGHQKIKSIAEIPNAGSELTADQLQQLINEIDVEIINYRRGRKGNLNSYSIGGSVSRSISPGETLRELIALREHYEKLLRQIPTVAVTIYDSPDV